MEGKPEPAAEDGRAAALRAPMAGLLLPRDPLSPKRPIPRRLLPPPKAAGENGKRRTKGHRRGAKSRRSPLGPVCKLYPNREADVKEANGSPLPPAQVERT